MTNNPYDWTQQNPQVEIPRPELAGAAEGLLRGRSFILLAGRGMGKSVFLRQLQRELEGDDVRVFLFPEPPIELTAQSCLRQLGRKLGVETEGMDHASEVLDEYFSRDVPRNVVLLFDEFDRYGRLPKDELESRPGRDFFNSIEAMRRSPPRSGVVGVLAAGSIGAFIFRDVLGSPFVDRAGRTLISPFDRDQLAALARPFAERGRELPAGVREALHLASGGNPALATYGLGELWPLDDPDERDVSAAFTDFLEVNRDFVRGFQLSFSNPRLSDAPQKVWDLIRKSDGTVSRDALEAACGPPSGPLHLDYGDVLTLLKAAGLIEITGSMRADEVVVRPVTSILNLPSRPANGSDLRERLRQDLESLLFRLHVSSADFFRPGRGGEGKKLVPESVFAAFLVLGLELLGWQADRETQRGAGRTDVVLRWAKSSEVAVVETKIWGRHDYRNVQRQIESYWTAETRAGAVVMLTDAEMGDWPEKYRESCLQDVDVDVPEVDPASPVRVRLHVSTQTSDGMAVEVDHFLLRLPRGR